MSLQWRRRVARYHIKGRRRCRQFRLGKSVETACLIQRHESAGMPACLISSCSRKRKSSAFWRMPMNPRRVDDA